MAAPKLYSYAGDFRALKALLAGAYNGVAIERPEFVLGKDNVTPEFLAKSPAGKVPVLETSEGCIWESNACVVPRSGPGQRRRPAARPTAVAGGSGAIRRQAATRHTRLQRAVSRRTRPTPPPTPPPPAPPRSIARYIAKTRRDTELTGRTFFESGLVDAWVDFASHEVELPACMWVFPVLGYTEFNKAGAY